VSLVVGQYCSNLTHQKKTASASRGTLNTKCHSIVRESIDNTVRLDPSTSLIEIVKNARSAKGDPRYRFWFGSPCYWFLPLDFFLHVVTPQIIAKPLPRCARLLRLTSTRWDRSWIDSEDPISLGRISYVVVRPLIALQNHHKIIQIKKV
jgi:hypothetical protein